jgi:hypothetical protein
VIADLVLLAAAAPEDDDVVAGWTGFAVFAFLVLAVAFLGWSLTRQLRKTDRAAEQGLYDPSVDRRRRGTAPIDTDVTDTEDAPRESGD